MQIDAIIQAMGGLSEKAQVALVLCLGIWGALAAPFVFRRTSLLDWLKGLPKATETVSEAEPCATCGEHAERGECIRGLEHRSASLENLLTEMRGDMRRIFERLEAMQKDLSYLLGKDAATVSAHAIADGNTVLARKQILVVEDEKHQAEWLSMLLQSHGAEVDTARTIGDADRYCEDMIYDVVLCDANIEQGFDGIAFCRRVRADSPSTKIIVITGYEQALAEAVGVAACVIKKPAEIAHIVEACR